MSNPKRTDVLLNGWEVGQVYDLDVIRPQFEDFKREVAKGA